MHCISCRDEYCYLICSKWVSCRPAWPHAFQLLNVPVASIKFDPCQGRRSTNSMTNTDICAFMSTTRDVLKGMRNNFTLQQCKWVWAISRHIGADAGECRKGNLCHLKIYTKRSRSMAPPRGGNPHSCLHLQFRNAGNGKLCHCCSRLRTPTRGAPVMWPGVLICRGTRSRP